MKRAYLVGLGLVGLICVPVVLKIARGEPARAVETEKVGYHKIKSSILSSGHLLYKEQVLLTPEVIGKVTNILVKEGGKVAAGDIVLHLDDQSYRAEVAQQEAAVRQQRIDIEQQQINLANQEGQYRRKTELHKVKMISDSALDDARYAFQLAQNALRNSRSRLEQVEAILKQSKERLAKTTIRAPIAGTVTALDIKVGETAVASQVSIAGSSLMTIANTSTMIAEVNVDEADIARVMVGQDVAIHTAAYPDTAIEGAVLEIPLSPKQGVSGPGQVGPSLSRNYNIKVRLSDYGALRLRPGMTCRAEIFTSHSGQSLALPLQAVLSNNEESATLTGKRDNKKPEATVNVENYVFVAKDGKAEKRVITLGMSDDNMQAVAAGLNAGESVITGPYKLLRQLRAGDRITVSAPAKSVVADAKGMQ